MSEFKDYVSRMSNFGIRSQNVLDNVILSGNVAKRTTTLILDNIMQGTSEWLSSDAVFQEA